MSRLDPDDLTVARFRKFLRLAGPPDSGAARRMAPILDQPVDDEPDAPTWREWCGLPDHREQGQ